MAADNNFSAPPVDNLHPLKALAAVEAWNQEATLLVSTDDVTLRQTSWIEWQSKVEQIVEDKYMKLFILNTSSIGGIIKYAKLCPTQQNHEVIKRYNWAGLKSNKQMFLVTYYRLRIAPTVYSMSMCLILVNKKGKIINTN